jgi:hypothetical protein
MLTRAVITMLFAFVALSPSHAQNCGTWVDATNRDGAPLPCLHGAMAFDSTRGVAVHFGGEHDFLATASTHEWNGTTWSVRAAAGPSARYYHAMAFDSARGVTVLFGGSGASAVNAETWEWDGTSWTLRSVGGPSARWGHAMAYDAARGVCVLYGGVAGPTIGDTWEWDGIAWYLRSGASPPGNRSHASMAYDSDRQRIVMFGGVVNFAPNGDTWEWDGESWDLRATTGPPARQYAALAFDTSAGKVRLYGWHQFAEQRALRRLGMGRNDVAVARKRSRDAPGPLDGIRHSSKYHSDLRRHERQWS